ncbi:MAG: thioredoxin [Planctomycetes bacterium]|nr:thioredoxin [Planctomycetota bacterium]
MTENIIELTDATFDEIVNSSEIPVLVDFWAPWCGPCKMIAPLVDEIAEEYAEKAKICKVNTDEHREAAVEYAINAIPTVILFQDGQIAKKWVGMVTKKDMTKEIDAVINELLKKAEAAEAEAAEAAEVEE